MERARLYPKERSQFLSATQIMTVDLRASVLMGPVRMLIAEPVQIVLAVEDVRITRV